MKTFKNHVAVCTLTFQLGRWKRLGSKEEPADMLYFFLETEFSEKNLCLPLLLTRLRLIHLKSHLSSLPVGVEFYLQKQFCDLLIVF